MIHIGAVVLIVDIVQLVGGEEVIRIRKLHIGILLLLLVLVPNRVSSSSIILILANDFAEKYNDCIQKMNSNILDLKKCKQANKAWDKLYNSEEWPK